MNKDYSKKKKKKKCCKGVSSTSLLRTQSMGSKSKVFPKIVELLNKKRPKKLLTYCLNRSELIRGKLSLIFLYTYI